MASSVAVGAAVTVGVAVGGRVVCVGTAAVPIWQPSAKVRIRETNKIFLRILGILYLFPLAIPGTILVELAEDTGKQGRLTTPSFFDKMNGIGGVLFLALRSSEMNWSLF